MNRKGIGDLVGDHDTSDRLRVGAGRDLLAPDHVTKPAFGKARQRLRQAVRIGLDEAVLERRAALRRLLGESSDDVPGERANSRPIFADDKGIGAIEAFPALRDLPRQGDTEEGVSLGRGQEVAGATRPAHGGEVVPPHRMIERQLHEPGKGDAATGGVDLGADDRNQIRIAAVGNVIGIESAGWR